jgi:hypothetical protein
MTEAEWLTCTDPEPMLCFLQANKVNRTRAGRRKLRLFGCGSGHRITKLMSEQGRLWIDIGGRIADRLLTSDEQRRVGLPFISPLDPPTDEGAETGRVGRSADQSAWCTLLPNIMEAASGAAHHAAMTIGIKEVPTGRSGAEHAAERRTQTVLLSDVFGPLPFRPATADPSWLTSTVVSLAEGIYAERAFDRLPILADALQDAGCDNHDILDHCWGDGPHVRGCWVVDLLVGKG